MGAARVSEDVEGSGAALDGEEEEDRVAIGDWDHFASGGLLCEALGSSHGVRHLLHLRHGLVQLLTGLVGQDEAVVELDSQLGQADLELVEKVFVAVPMLELVAKEDVASAVFEFTSEGIPVSARLGVESIVDGSWVEADFTDVDVLDESESLRNAEGEKHGTACEECGDMPFEQILVS